MEEDFLSDKNLSWEEKGMLFFLNHHQDDSLKIMIALMDFSEIEQLYIKSAKFLKNKYIDKELHGFISYIYHEKKNETST